MSTVATQPWSWEPGRRITGAASAPVTERQFLVISGPRDAGGNISVAPAGAGARVIGVAGYTALAGGLVLVARGGVVKVTAGAAAINGGDPIASDTNGHAVTASGTAVVVGVAVNSAAANGVAEVALY